MLQPNNPSDPANFHRLGTLDPGMTNDFWVGDEARLKRLCRAFECATGWKIRDNDTATDPRRVAKTDRIAETVARSGQTRSVQAAVIEPAVPRPPVSQSQAELLAGEIHWLLQELNAARSTVWQREAELAAGVPVRRRVDEETHLAARLEAILKGGAEAVSCKSAGIYLLDEATSELKLRACWGMPRNKLMEPARPLRGAIADLEALLGHAVVIEQTSMLPHWRVPEHCAAAACVPISTPTEPLGTLWVFCDQPRDFSASQTNLLEIIAGRVASELQRDMLLTECTQTRSVDQQLSAAAEWQHAREPLAVSRVDNWEMAGFSSHMDYPGGSFFDWWVSTDGHVTIAAGSSGENSLRGAMSAAELRGMLHAVAAENRDCASSIQQLQELLRDTTPNARGVALGLVRVASPSCIVDGSLTSNVAGWHYAQGTWQGLSCTSPFAGCEKSRHENRERPVIQPGELLVLAAFDFHDEREREIIGRLISENLQPGARSLQEQAVMLRQVFLNRLSGCHGSLVALRRQDG